jgi:hypothetical protein
MFTLSACRKSATWYEGEDSFSSLPTTLSVQFLILSPKHTIPTGQVLGYQLLLAVTWGWSLESVQGHTMLLPFFTSSLPGPGQTKLELKGPQGWDLPLLSSSPLLVAGNMSLKSMLRLLDTNVA